ncbi:MAG: hypothetical protein WCP85_30750 [Mariniphaga sp.]
MKTTNVIILLLLLELSYQRAKAQFMENSLVRTPFALLLTNISTDGAIALQTSDYNIEDNTTMRKSMILDLQGFNLTNTSLFTCTLTDNKYFSLKDSTGLGVFSGKIKFGGTDSFLKVHSSNVLGSGFSIDATDVSGEIEIGDGTTSVRQSINSSQCNGKVSLFTVTSGATLIISIL